MRGKESRFSSAMVFFRITPAYAGKRCGGSGGGAYSKDHPRLCGEKKVYPKDSEIILGSPPPMRGKAFVYFTKNVVCRITPAYAGKSFFHEFYNFFNEDHPRLCGEKLNLFRPCYCSMGSPPPMRGKDSVTLYRDHVVRITPAYAGKSSNHNHQHCEREDHPRLCGEKKILETQNILTIGSPPPMRGKAQAAGWTELSTRITPAYAGKSSGWRWVITISQDHPRLCGEKS